MAVADWDDLVNTGAIPVGGSPSDPKWSRATGLLQAATDQALAHITTITGAEVDETTVAAWPDRDRRILAIIVAEIAGRRLTVPATSTATQVDNGLGSGWMTALLTDVDRRNLARIPSVGATGGTKSVLLAQGTLRPSTWSGWPIDGSTIDSFTW
jgi:hypothetical protein